MLLINEHVVATVFRTQVVSSDETSILVEAGGYTPMRWFLEHAANATACEVEPPRKKIKIERSREIVDDSNVPYEVDLIPIHDVSIDLHFPETLKTKTPHQRLIEDDVKFEKSDEVPVFAYGIESRRDGTQLRLGMVKGDAVAKLETDYIPAAVIDALRQIGPPGQAKDAHVRRRSKTRPATVLRCSLARSTGELYTVVRLRASILWKSGSSAFPAGVPVGMPRIYEDYEVLARAYPDQARQEVDHSQPWTPQDFYESVHVPSEGVDTKGLYNGVLETELYPFQKRAVTWMLSREGVKLENGVIRYLDEAERNKDNLRLFEPIMDGHNNECYINYVTGVITRKKPEEQRLSGGLLAEEMGLGKTVELMALLSLHKSPKGSATKVLATNSGTNVTVSRATLIITPASILQQWKSELGRHAPALKVSHYEGIPSGHKQAKTDEEIISELASQYDVVLATYQTLGNEVHFAEDPPERYMRRTPKYNRRRSPLVQIQWWRICIDEAQMVESGVTAAARVACRLPRVNSWAVSGTPLRKNVQDLHGLLIFLRCKPFDESAKLWSHLITNHRDFFRRIFKHIALRHTKARIRGELHLPAQKRVVITVPFSAVEQQHYTTLFNEMCAEIGLNNEGAPLLPNWDPESQGTTEAMRNWLVRLRQTCLHPQVGGRNRRALGRGQGPLRTVAEVLEVMVEQNESNARVEERALLSAQLQRAHILGNNREDNHRSEKALEIYKLAMEASATLVLEARERLAAVKASLAATEGRTTDTEDEDSASESTPLLGRLRANLRSALQLQHVCTFFTATAFFQIKSNETLITPESEHFKQLEDQETRLYESAKQLRKEILRDASRKAESLMRKMKDLTDRGALVALPAIKRLKSLGGIENRRLVEKSDGLFEVLRAQGDMISEQRGKMAEYLLKPLVDEENGIETTGDEYEDSTKQQDELFVLFDVVKALQADLNTFITGEDAPLIDHEVKKMIKDAKSSLDPDYEFNGVVHAPELLLKLFTVRNTFRDRYKDLGSVRGFIQEARTLETSMQFQGSTRSAAERALVMRHLSALQKTFSDYTKALNNLEKEIDLFRNTQNQRLDFYRQLQELSDAVAPYKEELDEQLDAVALEAASRKEERHTNSLAQLRTKHRFLLNLRDESDSHSSPKICVICQCPFENGVLTVCGHQYCRDCIHHWWSQHRTCPVCKRKLSNNDFHNITYKPQELRAQEEVHSSMSSSSATPTSSMLSQRSSIYSDVDTELMEQIKSIDLPASYGSKVETLGRHLHWIREHDPGAKSVVFSQYREFLDVLGTALREFKIGYSRLGRSGAVEKFKHDPSVDCLLLDAKTDSSGLTLVNATHVFICEPLIQTAVELQAIARVHRIGQTRTTTVWMYLITDTVEEAIYEISVARRLAHMQSREAAERDKSRASTPGILQETAIDAANSEEMQSAPISNMLVAGKGGGELVGNDDLWQCLFGKAQKTGTKPGVELVAEMGTHLRAEAAEQRRSNTTAPVTA